MGADYTHIQPGEPFTGPDAATWNALLDSAKLVRDALRRRTNVPSLSTLVIPSLTIEVENVTGGNLVFGAPVRLGNEAYTLDLNFRHRPVYQAHAPTGDGNEVIAILAEPLVGYVSGNAANGTGNGIGRAVIAGHAVTTINISNTTHLFARAATGDTSVLHSNASTGFPILGNISGTGNLTLGVLLDRGFGNVTVTVSPPPPPAPSSDCGGLFGLNANSCLFVDVEPGSGNCGNVPASTSIMMVSNETANVWETPKPVDLGDGNATIHFTPGNAATHGYPAAWISGFGSSPDDYYLQISLANCTDGNLTFRGGLPVCGNQGNGPNSVPCPPETFTLSFSCNCGRAGWYCIDDEGVPTCVEYESGPPAGVTVLSGPHDTEEECAAVCADEIDTACCDDIPATLYLHVTSATGDYACLDGLTFRLDYNVDDEHWYWSGVAPCVIEPPDPPEGCETLDVTTIELFCDEGLEEMILHFGDLTIDQATANCAGPEWTFTGDECDTGIEVTINTDPTPIP